MVRTPSTKDRAFGPTARVESDKGLLGGLFVKSGLAVLALIAGFWALQGQTITPINTMCPVKPKQKAKATYYVQYEGQVIGFC